MDISLLILKPFTIEPFMLHIFPLGSASSVVCKIQLAPAIASMFQADKDYFPAASHSQTVCETFPKKDGKCGSISHYHKSYTHLMSLCWFCS